MNQGVGLFGEARASKASEKHDFVRHQEDRPRPGIRGTGVDFPFIAQVHRSRFEV